MVNEVKSIPSQPIFMYDYEEQVDISERTLSFNIKCGEERNIFEGVSVATLTFQCENCRGGDG